MEFQTSATKTLRSLLEQFKPMQTSQQDSVVVNDSVQSSIANDDLVKSSPTPTVLYKVSPSTSFSIATQSPTMVFKSSPKPDGNTLYKLELTPHLSEDGGIIRRTRTVIPYSVKCQISSLAEENPRITQGEIAQIFGIDRTTVSKILKRRRDFLDDSSQGPKPKASRLSNAAQVNDEIESALFEWYINMEEKNVVVTQSMIMDAAISMSQRFNVDKYIFSKQWLVGFLNRYKITCKDVFLSDVDVLSMQQNCDDNSYNKALQHIANLASQKHNNSSTKYLIPGDTDTHSGGLKATKLQKSQTNSATRSSEASAASTSLPNSQRLVHPKPTSMPIPNHALSTGNKIPRNRIAIPQPEGNEISPEIIHIKQEIEDTELNDEEALSREMGNLEKFREQQKMIEEANKQRKALLAKTLSERQRRAREEAQKLAHIQKELQLLDNRLSADVTVIRSRIEVASREFLDAQKRYDKAEREFIESKLDLQKKSELKEQLTEHLYTIIHQNEVRKAQKLSELMTELELEAKEDGVQMTNLPPLATFSTMNALKTLHSPKSQIEKTPLTSDKLVKNLTVEKSDSQTVKEKTNSVSDVATEKLDSNVEVQKGDSVIEASDSTEKRDKDDTKEGNTSKDKEPVIIPIDLSASSPENITEENEGSNVKSPHSEDPNNKGESNISQNGVQDSKSPNQKSDSSGDGQKADTECKTNTDNSDKSELCIMDVRTVTETESKSNIDSDNEKAQEDIPSTWTLNVVKVKDEPAT